MARIVQRLAEVHPRTVDDLGLFGPEDVSEVSWQRYLRLNRPAHRSLTGAKPQARDFGIAKIVEESDGIVISKASGLPDNSTPEISVGGSPGKIWQAEAGSGPKTFEPGQVCAENPPYIEQ